MPEITYQRLTRAGSRRAFSVAFQSRSSLWLGTDHLLCIDSNRFVENYKRFYFRDIQAIIICKSNRRAIWNAILTVPVFGCLLGLLGTLTSSDHDNKEFGSLVVLGFLAIFLLVMLVNTLRGMGCNCYLRTAVQVEELPSLRRLPKTRKVMAKLRPLIAAAQGGELSAEAAAAQVQEWVASYASQPPAGTPADPDIPPRLE